MEEDWNRINEIYNNIQKIKGDVVLYMLDTPLGKEINNILKETLDKIEQTVRDSRNQQ